MGRAIKMLQARRPAFIVLTMLSWNEAVGRLWHLLFYSNIYCYGFTCLIPSPLFYFTKHFFGFSKGLLTDFIILKV